jgi:hypothetical protein
LIITLFFVGVTAWIGYQIYVSVNKIREKASERMSNKNVVFTRDGMKVGVKDIKNESYVDATQGWVVKAWNLASNEKEKEQAKKKYATRDLVATLMARGFD